MPEIASPTYESETASNRATFRDFVYLCYCINYHTHLIVCFASNLCIWDYYYCGFMHTEHAESTDLPVSYYRDQGGFEANIKLNGPNGLMRIF